MFYKVLLFFFVSFENWDHNFYFYTCSFQSEALVFGKIT